jgi:CBS domain-containing protein
MLAKDIMRRRVVSVSPKMSLREVAALFDELDISGAPVVGPEGGLIGVITKTDLLSQPARGAAEGARGLTAERRVEQAMTPWGVSVEEDTPVEDLARQMLSKRIHRLIITRGGEMCGIVTSLDIVRALLKMTEGRS